MNTSLARLLPTLWDSGTVYVDIPDLGLAYITPMRRLPQLGELVLCRVGSSVAIRPIVKFAWGLVGVHVAEGEVALIDRDHIDGLLVRIDPPHEYEPTQEASL